MSVLTFTINLVIIIVVISRCCVFHYHTGLVTIDCFVIMITIYGKPSIHRTKLYAKMFYKGNLTYEPKS